MKDKKKTSESTTNETPKAPVNESKKPVATMISVHCVEKQRVNRFGEPFLNGKKIAAHIVEIIPYVASCYSAGADIGSAIKACSEDVPKKEKAKVITKATGKAAAKITAGVIAMKCVDTLIKDTFDLDN